MEQQSKGRPSGIMKAMPTIKAKSSIGRPSAIVAIALGDWIAEMQESMAPSRHEAVIQRG